MSFVGDPLREAQPKVAAFLRTVAGDGATVELDAELRDDIGWRPHVLEVASRRAWHIHLDLPETDSWYKRMARARLTDATIKIGVAAPSEVLLDEEFILLCEKIDATIMRLPEPEFWKTVSPVLFASIADLVMETRAQLSGSVAKSLLDAYLEKSLQHPDPQRRGIIFETVVGLFLSQVRGFEVHDIGISNRSQQMDVFVQNRNVGGALSGSPVVLAEAKNWKDPVTTTEYSEFVRKLQSRHGRAKLGFLVTSGKFTEGVALERRRESGGEHLVVLVNGTDLVSTWRVGGSITEQVEGLVMRATVGT